MVTQNLPHKKTYHNSRLVTWLTGAVAALVFAIAAGAFVLSYDALYKTGAAHGVPAGKAWLWPLLIDAPLVVFTLALLVAQLTRQSIKLWAGLVVVYTLATIVFNLAHAQQDALGWLVAVVAPAGLLLTTEALRHQARTVIERQAAVGTLHELAQQAAHKQRELAAITAQVDAKQQQLDELQAAIVQAKSDNNVDFAATMQQSRRQKIAERRQEVLQLLDAGHSDKEIAVHLEKDVRTIRKDITALNGKVRK